MKIKGQTIFYGVIIVLVIISGFYINRKTVSQQINIEQFDIQKLSSEAVVVPYVKEYHRLPDYYISKSEARRLGWQSEKGNLCKTLPGKIIGGDRFTNREGRLPEKKGRIWTEADLNYDCGNRNTDRLIFSNDGLIYVTYDHYNTFQPR